MIYTNVHNLPQPIVAAITNSKYSRGDSDISVTQLIDPPRMIALQEQYKDKLVEDVSDSVFAMFGTAVHNVLDGYTQTKHAKRRLYTNCRGWTISGEFDYIDDDGTLWDWKVGSVWEVMNELKDTREPQLNLYALLASRESAPVKELKLGFILRDWQSASAERDSSYPPQPVAVVKLPLWDQAVTEAYLEERVRLHQEARVTLPECTDKERWAKPTVWAAMKNQNVKATKLFATENEALAWHQLQSDASQIRIVKRDGELTRCKRYCTVGKLGFCEQYNAILKSH